MEKEKKISTIVLAGGCFWCVAMPYYDLEGILEVTSGYIGGSKTDAIYEKVKSQQTLHREAIRLTYDQTKISLKEILDIYFSVIDPFDSGGQFIDRGSSYTLALFYNTTKDKSIISEYINSFEKTKNQKVAIEVLEETEFYPAEEYHQNYAIKNPKEMEEELINSGRIKEKLKL